MAEALVSWGRQGLTPVMLPVIGLALTIVAAGMNLSSALLALAVVLMLLSLFPLLRSAT